MASSDLCDKYNLQNFEFSKTKGCGKLVPGETVILARSPYAERYFLVTRITRTQLRGKELEKIYIAVSSSDPVTHHASHTYSLQMISPCSKSSVISTGGHWSSRFSQFDFVGYKNTPDEERPVFAKSYFHD